MPGRPGQLPEDTVNIRAGQIDFIQSDDHRHSGGLGVADGFLCLGHDSIIGSDYQNNYVGHVGPAGTHGGKGLVAGRVQEHHVLIAVVVAVGADRLGDSAGFAAGGALGARIAVRGGERVIRPVLALAVVALAGRMFGLY